MSDRTPYRWIRQTMLAAAVLVLTLSAGSASGQDPFQTLDDDFEARRPQIFDPLRPWNRAMFEVNDNLYFYALKPVAEIYKVLVPEPARIAVRNFFNNLAAPVRFTACLLQGKSERAGAELGAFMVNTTVGVLGLGNPAAGQPRLQVPAEDLGQSFAVWGIGHGPYLVWPLLGPSSLRDSLGRIGGHFLDPFTYVEPSKAGMIAGALDTVNGTSLRLGEYEALTQEAVAPYEAMRDAYVQYRQRQVEK